MGKFSEWSMMIKKIENIIKKWIREVLKEELTEVLKKQEEIKAVFIERLNEIPIFICWQCGKGIQKNSGRIVYMGKNFHNEICFKEYCRIIDLPDKNYKIFKGENIKEFNKSYD